MDRLKIEEDQAHLAMWVQVHHLFIVSKFWAQEQYYHQENSNPRDVFVKVNG